MPIRRLHLGVIAAVLLLSGCSYLDTVYSRLSGESSSSKSSSSSSGKVTAIAPSTAEANPQPTLSAAAPGLAPAPVAPGANTGTFVGQQISQLRNDLARLQSNINQHNAQLQQIRQSMAQDAANYFSQVGTVNSRLQVGTTPGNPQLIAQWNQAQGALDRMSSDIARLNSLSNQAASDSSLAAYILEQVRAAYGLQGAVDEDHRQLNQLENEVNRTVVLIDRLLNALSDDINRQSAYVNNERSNLVTLSLAIKNGELYGQSLQNRAFGRGGPVAASASRRSGSSTSAVSTSGRQPLVVIRFDRPNVSYEQALYTAVSRALERRPEAAFDLVAVSPNAGSAAQAALNTDASKRNAENVMRSLTNMGLPADRVSLSSTTSRTVQSNEVQLFVR